MLPHSVGYSATQGTTPHKRCEVLTTSWVSTASKVGYKSELSKEHQPISTGRHPRESKPLVHLLIGEHDVSHILLRATSDKNKT